jgi:hypothetical protein
MTGPVPSVMQVGDGYGSNWHPAPGGGVVAGTPRIRGRAVLIAGGVPLGDREFPPTGSGFPGAQSLMILPGMARPDRRLG